ncbi:hypothetical protein BgiMline_027294 [Biomphalaria glabrata]
MEVKRNRGFNEACESIQNDKEIEIDGKKITFDTTLAAAIKHFCFSSFKRVEYSDDAQTIKISSDTLTEFVLTGEKNDKFELYNTKFILELWDAAQELETPCLLRNCETIVGQILSEENFEHIYIKANLYQSPVLQDEVLRRVFDWAENYEKQDRNSGISKENRAQKSTKRKKDVEVSFKEGDQSSKLANLIRAADWSTASIECIQDLSKHDLCEKDTEAKLFISKVLNYKLDRNTHGFWPPYTTPKLNAECPRVGVLADQDGINALFLHSDLWLDFPNVHSIHK